MRKLSHFLGLDVTLFDFKHWNPISQAILLSQAWTILSPPVQVLSLQWYVLVMVFSNSPRVEYKILMSVVPCRMIRVACFCAIQLQLARRFSWFLITGVILHKTMELPQDDGDDGADDDGADDDDYSGDDDDNDSTEAQDGECRVLFCEYRLP